MKSKFVALVVLMFVMVTTTFAKNINENVNEKALTAFNQKFADAKEVSWFKADTYYKATFKLNEQYLTAFISEAGEWMGISRNLVSYQLPINLQTEMRKNYGQYWITELFEFATEDGTNYYAIVENADQKVTLKSTGSEWSVFKKTKKD